jgi:hypothetical protein
MGPIGLLEATESLGEVSVKVGDQSRFELVREISCNFVDRMARLPKRAIHEITRNLTNQLKAITARLY